jgi:hypothetical protein
MARQINFKIVLRLVGFNSTAHDYFISDKVVVSWTLGVVLKRIKIQGFTWLSISQIKLTDSIYIFRRIMPTSNSA